VSSSQLADDAFIVKKAEVLRLGSTIGVLGPKDLVATMIELATEHYPQYSFINLSYTDESETGLTFEKNQHRMDVCLFTGIWPYAKIRNNFAQAALTMPMVHAHHSGALFKTIARMIHLGAIFNRVSIDVVSEDEAELTFAEVGNRPKELFLMPFRDAVPRANYVAFHKDLWRAGRTTAMITLLTSAYSELSQEGLPVYHCSIGLAAMREAIARAVLELQTVQMREQQIVVGVVEVGGHQEKVFGEMHAGQRHKMSLYQIILNFGERTGISVVPLEGLRFGLFLTRGSLQQITSNSSSFSLAAILSEVSGAPAFIGFGVGPTVNSCYGKAMMAHSYAKRFGTSSAFVVFDNGDVCGPLGSTGTSLAYSRRSIDKKMLFNAEESGLGIATLSRVKAVIEGSGTVLLTPEQLADGLRISKRNARRILAKLTDAGLATIMGIDQPGTRGRPQRVFQVNLD